MSTDRDVTRIVRSWLEDGVTELPDRVLDSVLDQLPSTPQRRHSWQAWRNPLVSSTLKFAMAGAAALAVGVIAIGLYFNQSGGVGPPAPSPSPTPSPTAVEIAQAYIEARNAYDPARARELVADEFRTGEPDEAYRNLSSLELAFEPGTRFDYAVTNWILVIAVVEAASGKPFQAVMRELVLTPLGMSATTAADDIDASPMSAASYRSVSPPQPWPNPRRPYLAASGGYFSTAPDLLRAAHGAFDTDFLRAQSREVLTRVRFPAEDYALGGRVRQVLVGNTRRRLVWGTGSAAGFRTLLAHDLDSGETWVVLNNTGIRQDVLNDFGLRLFGAHAALV
jgi:CubicO group peptidase (beta-lactamase class C family)